MFHDQRELVQFTPARAKKKLLIAELKPKHQSMWTEEKIDGERYLIHSNKPAKDAHGSYKHACTSRRESEVSGRMVEKTDRVPHLMNIDLPEDSLFDNEFVSSGDEVQLELPGKFWDKMEPGRHADFIKAAGYLPCYPHVGATVSIMGSLGPEAVRKQKERGLIRAYCFDIISYMNRDVRHNTQLQRRKFLNKLMENIDPAQGMVLMPAFFGLSLREKEELFYLITDIGGEGLIEKDPNEPYNAPSNWYKIKKDYPGDCVYTGVSKEGEEGKTGKMLGLAASLEIGVYHNGELIPVGWISAIRDGEAGLQTPEEHFKTWTGLAVEVRHNGLQVKPGTPLGYTLRHPRFRRDRSNDKNGKDCTWDNLYAEAIKKLG